MNRSFHLEPTRFVSFRQQAHPRCMVCSPANPLGLGLEFALRTDGSVEGSFAGNDLFEGYPGRLHGGLVAALLDGAMTNCLFAHGIQAVTAELRVRYRHPVAARSRLTVGAYITKAHTPLFLLEAHLTQDSQEKAWAAGKFIELPTDS